MSENHSGPSEGPLLVYQILSLGIGGQTYFYGLVLNADELHTTAAHTCVGPFKYSIEAVAAAREHGAVHSLKDYVRAFGA